jgi:hypothetical protein
MKTGIKLTLGVVFAAVAIVSATETGTPGAESSLNRRLKGSFKEPCYTESEVQLLMKANHWTKKQATDILDLACSYTGDSNQ